MKHFSLFTAALAAATALALPAHAYTGSATASVLSPLSITSEDPINFGSFSSSGTAGTVKTDGSKTGGVTIITEGNPASFGVSGYQNQNYNIIGDSTVTLNDGSGHSMVANLDYPTNPQSLAGGAGIFTVSGTLAVGANQAAGNYTGSYTVNVSY